MRLYAFTFFLTLVVSGLAANAAPFGSSQPSPIEISPKTHNEPIFPSSEDEEKNWSFRVGFLSGAVKETNLAEQITFYGVRYDFLKKPLSTWQFEITTARNNFIHLVLGKKFSFPLEDLTHPYYKFSIGEFVESTEGIGSVFNIKKIQAMAAIGLDDLFHWNKRFQGEIVLSYALHGPQLEFSLGLAF